MELIVKIAKILSKDSKELKNMVLTLCTFRLRKLYSVNKIIENIRLELIRNADEKIKQSGERFFKEEVIMYGIKSALVIRIGKDHYKALPDRSKSHVFSLCEEL